LPAEARGFSADIAEKVRSNWVTEIDTDAPPELLALAVLELVGVLLLEVEVLLLQAAAARHKASDADATTAPFLAS
jgi:hypothetical protein